ncbi:MAG: CarD family transcriptional regulator, partial [Terriglobia bacterium]
MANLTEVLSAVRESDQFSQLTEQISAGSGEIQAQVTGPLRAPVIAAVFLATGRGITAVTEGGGQAAQLAGDIAAYLGESKVRQLPDPEVLPFERLSTPPDVVAERARILDDARSGPPFVIVAQVKTLIRRTTPHKRYPAPFDITAGMEADFDGLIEYLVGVGFRRVPVVEARGEFSVRGGIVDLFPGDSDSPIRADFFGNEVDSIREFAVESQESIGALDSVRVYPCREVVIEARDVGLGRSRLGPALDDEVSMDLAAFESGKVFSGAEFYVPYVYETPESVPEALPDDWPSFLCEPGDLRAGADAFLETADDFMRGRLHFTGVNASLEDYFDDFDSFRLRCRTMVSLTRNPAEDALFRLKHSPVPSFLGKIDSLEEYLRDGAKTGETTVVTARPGTVARVKERVTKDLAGNDQGMRALAAARFVAGHLSEGHELPAFKLRVVTERDLFGRIVGLPPARRRRDVQSGLRLADIKQGDFVVHRTHGIGRYHQMVQRDMGDGRKDYLELRYGGGDKLFIPLGQIGNVFKYQGAGGAPPLSRLGSAKWSRTKRRVKEALRELAADLFKLYEHRRKAKGFAFSGDTHWQQELEQTF